MCVHILLHIHTRGRSYLYIFNKTLQHAWTGLMQTGVIQLLKVRAQETKSAQGFLNRCPHMQHLLGMLFATSVSNSEHCITASLAGTWFSEKCCCLLSPVGHLAAADGTPPLGSRADASCAPARASSSPVQMPAGKGCIMAGLPRIVHQLEQCRM